MRLTIKNISVHFAPFFFEKSSIMTIKSNFSCKLIAIKVLWVFMLSGQFCCYGSALTDPQRAMQFVDNRLNGLNNTLGKLYKMNLKNEI